MEIKLSRKFRIELIFLIVAIMAAAALVWTLVAHGQEMIKLCQYDFSGVITSAIFLFVGMVILAGWAIHKIGREQAIYARELEIRNEKMRDLAVTDGLTKVYNHRYFEHRLEKEWERFERFHHPLACVMIDVDNFKQINDKFGHRGGDMVLRGVADMLRENLREVDIISRYGGEEFTILLFERPSHIHGLKLTMEKIRKKIEKKRFLINKSPVKITASLGGALVPNTKIKSPDELVQFADQAMYLAKERGKNRSAVFSET